MTPQTHLPLGSQRPVEPAGVGGFTGYCPVVSSLVRTSPGWLDRSVASVAVDGHRLALKCPRRGGGSARSC